MRNERFKQLKFTTYSWSRNNRRYDFNLQNGWQSLKISSWFHFNNWNQRIFMARSKKTILNFKRRGHYNKASRTFLHSKSLHFYDFTVSHFKNRRKVLWIWFTFNNPNNIYKSFESDIFICRIWNSLRTLSKRNYLDSPHE